MNLKFGKFLDVLNAAGVKTKSARGHWGGLAEDGVIVVTAWTHHNDGQDHFFITRPKTNHGGLRTQWEVGAIRPGTEVRLIVLEQKGHPIPFGEDGPREVASAALAPGKWRVVKQASGKGGWPMAVVEPAPEEPQPISARVAEPSL
jgi:hypothetical protein